MSPSNIKTFLSKFTGDDRGNLDKSYYYSTEATAAETYATKKELFGRISAQISATRTAKAEVVEAIYMIQDSSSRMMQAIEERIKVIEKGQTMIIELLQTIKKEGNIRSCLNNMYYF